MNVKKEMSVEQRKDFLTNEIAVAMLELENLKATSDDQYLIAQIEADIDMHANELHMIESSQH